MAGGTAADNLLRRAHCCRNRGGSSRVGLATPQGVGLCPKRRPGPDAAGRQDDRSGYPARSSHARSPHAWHSTSSRFLGGAAGLQPYAWSRRAGRARPAAASTCTAGFGQRPTSPPSADRSHTPPQADRGRAPPLADRGHVWRGPRSHSKQPQRTTAPPPQPSVPCEVGGHGRCSGRPRNQTTATAAAEPSRVAPPHLRARR
mmetsp:Transcript_73552/g.212875  ORF Transcript_73552/g.212875 Transcript_73552/m.212875 type:complete len:202 (+) Transcript_73552:195-800(+)